MVVLVPNLKVIMFLDEVTRWRDLVFWRGSFDLSFTYRTTRRMYSYFQFRYVTYVKMANTIRAVIVLITTRSLYVWKIRRGSEL